jgi:hypothetical protein
MNQKQFTAEEIIVLLNEANVRFSQCRNMTQVYREMGITEKIYLRCLREYAEVKGAQSKIQRNSYDSHRSGKSIRKIHQHNQ